MTQPLDAQFRLASAWRAKGHLDRAAAGYREILRADPGHVAAALKLGEVADDREAEAVLAQAVRHHPHEATLQKRFLDVLVRRRGIAAAFEHHGLDRQDSREIALRPGEVLGCSVVRNEGARLPYWLRYHRRRGVSRFLVVDNGSTDGTLELLLDEPDVHVWRTGQSYHAAYHGTVWIELLLRRHGVGHWCLLADADELFLYPDCDTVALPDLSRRLAAQGKRAVGAIMLDMYSAKPIRDTHYTPGEDFLAVCRHFDRRFSHGTVERWTLEGTQTIEVGGVRARVFGDGGGDYYLSKVPFLRYDAETVLSPHWTNIPAADVAAERGCLLHFKYFASFSTYVVEEAERQEHVVSQYGAYADRVTRDADLTLFDPEHSVEFRDARQLLDLGIMRADRQDADAPFVRLRVANIWRAKGKLDRAIAGYREILRMHPDYLPARLELDEVLGRPQPAAVVLQSAAVMPLGRARGAKHVVVYTDRPDAYGAEQIGHMLMLHLAERGYAVSCVQPAATNHLVDERSRAGIDHLWLSAKSADEVLATAAPDLIVFNDGAPLASLDAKEAAARRGIPYVIVNHCVSPAWAEESGAELGRLPPVYRGAAAVIAVSEENLGLLRDRFGLPADVGAVIVNGRPAQYFAPPDVTARRRIREELGIRDDAVVVFTAGRLELVKGYQYVLAAMKQLRRRQIWPCLHFMWAGKGTLEGQLRAVVAESGMASQVTFLGERADVPSLLDAADVFLLPSQFEGMPLALIEAMAKGVPVIATAVSGTPEALGEAGVLLPDPRVDADATVAALVTTLDEWAARPERRQAYGRAGRERAEALFRGERMLAAYLALIERSLRA